MTLITKVLIHSITFLMALSLNAQDSNVKSAIIGRWKFDKMEFNGALASIDKTEQNRVNKLNEGNIISFIEDGTYKTTKVINGKTIKSASGKYQILNSGKFLSLDGMKAKIYFFNDNVIKLTSDNRPVMVWRRVKS